ncbi:MAG: OmpA family protein, partial [Lachnospiraceae bacterium]
MKKIFGCLLILTVTLVLVACGNDEAESVSTDNEKEIVENVESDSTASNVVGENYVGSFLCETIGDGININSDGTFVAYNDYENKIGKVIGTYSQDGEEWIFLSPIFPNGSKNGSFDGQNWHFDGNEYIRKTSPITLDAMVKDIKGIFILGNQITILGTKVEDLGKLGLSTSLDYKNMTLSSGATIDIDVSYGDAKATVQVINPYENEVSLGECLVCSFYTEDTSNTYQLDGSGNTCGVDNYDDLLDFDVYEYTSEKLVYKTYIFHLDYINVAIDDPKGDQIIKLSGDTNLTLRFDGLTLKSFRYDLSDVANYGLNNNVNADILNMDASTLEDVVEVRDNILADLKTAFSDANIDLNINEKNGEIVMDNSILFATDAYELSDMGKQYIDQFVGVYAQVLLSDKFRDNVAEVRFEGHTDSRGDFGYNQNLSQKRAEAVLDYCIGSTANGL